MKSKQVLDVLTRLPYQTVTIFDGKKTQQKTVILYSEITKEISKNRQYLLKKGFHYLDGKLINAVSGGNLNNVKTRVEKRR
ncbi:MAG: hypothetical protein ACK5RV_12740 [Flavobacterium sp.]|jgi:hypothetical protein|uniref:hypothetical protein n=1 Tax=Flavobacterium sp. TaxID=239 RepID=UPI0022C90CA6|nr:hypothetical protein [Flavobacterium sp.]MCZ8168191.1 hypothetical protein [Flavobacterium sp.]MCZ8297254.1 hypothetical protein [Flavobacterium sp.]